MTEGENPSFVNAKENFMNMRTTDRMWLNLGEMEKKYEVVVDISAEYEKLH